MESITIEVGTKATGKIGTVKLNKHKLDDLVEHFGEAHILQHYYKSRAISEANKVRSTAKAPSLNDQKMRLLVDGKISLEDAKTSGDGHISALYQKHYGIDGDQIIVVEW
jgi:hypothetical protein